MAEDSAELLFKQNEAVGAKVSLPQDIQQMILSFLPGRVIVKFRRVCKFWEDCITEPTFMDRQLDNALRFHQSIACFASVDGGLVHMYTFDPTTMNFRRMDLVFSCRFHMSSPCNGLVCAYNFNGDVELLNPTTREHLALPVSEFQSQAPFSEFFVGFVHSTKEYKVVSVRHRVRFLTFEVCTVGTPSWRMVRESVDLLKTTKAVVTNNGMHWLLLDEVSSYRTRRILSFNLTDEKFSETVVPDAVKSCDLELFEGDGELHLFAVPNNLSTYSEIWVTNWTRQVWVRMCTYSVSPEIPLGTKPCFLHKKKIFYGTEKRLSYIDLEAGKVYYVDMPSGECFISAGMFVESFLLPSVTGLVKSTALLDNSHCAGSSSRRFGPSSLGTGSISTGPGRSSGLAQWSSADLFDSSKRASSNLNMKWKVIKVKGEGSPNGVLTEFN